MIHPALSDENAEKLITALEGLGQEADADVLSSARAAHGVISEAGIAWRDLLETEEVDDLPSYGDDEPDDDAPLETVSDAAATATVSKADGDDDLARIDKLIGSGKISDDTVEDLMAMKEDLAEGEFREMDRNYLRKLEERVFGTGKKGKR